MCASVYVHLCVMVLVARDLVCLCVKESVCAFVSRWIVVHVCVGACLCVHTDRPIAVASLLAYTHNNHNPTGGPWWMP